METEEATQQREGVPPSDSKGGEKKDEKEETPQEKKEKIRRYGRTMARGIQFVLWK